MNSQAVKKQIAASRFLLPTEILLGLTTMAAGIVAGMPEGLLHKVLLLHGENWSWLIPYTFVGGTSSAVAMYEWCALRKAPNPRIFVIASVRSVLNFLGFSVWAGGLFVLVAHGHAHQVMIHTLLACICCPFFAWCYVENLKVRYALNPHVETPTLEFHR